MSSQRTAVNVTEAYGEVERVTRRRARNFAYGVMVLPPPKRRAITAIYAFARKIDDIADGELPPAEKRAQLEALRQRLDAPPNGDAVFVALADTRARYDIPDQALQDLVDGGLRDLEQTRYATFDDLRGYCRLVAGAVGRACLPVYGGRDSTRAETLGIALQVINILRDVAEDWQLGRVYLPQDELASFGVSEEDIAAHRCTPGWRSLAALQAERARLFLADGLELVRELDTRSALCLSTFTGLYSATLDRIEAAGFDVFHDRPRLSALSKLKVVGRGLRDGQVTPRKPTKSGSKQHVFLLNDDGSVTFVPTLQAPDAAIANLNDELRAVWVETAVRSPYVVPDLCSTYEKLLKDPAVSEQHFQEFLGEHPEFILGDEYDMAFPQVVLPIGVGAGSLRPDFILRPIAGVTWDAQIVELKLPTHRLLRSTPLHHEGFYKCLHDAFRQLKAYRRYFEEDLHRSAFASRMNFTIYRPKLALVIGRTKDFPSGKSFAEMTDDLQPVEVLSFDDLLVRQRRFLDRVRHAHR